MRRTFAGPSILCALAAAVLAIAAGVERHARAALEDGNRSLRQRLAQMDPLLAENQRLSDLLAHAAGGPSGPNARPETPPTADERAQEIVRLRGEVSALRQQCQEIETLREDTRRIRAAQPSALTAKEDGPASQAGGGMNAKDSRLQILTAEYWTDNSRLDVADALRNRIRGDSLKAVASNNLQGDPEFGKTKHLTVVYDFDGVTRTNDFREGDLVVLPGEQAGP